MPGTPREIRSPVPDRQDVLAILSRELKAKRAGRADLMDIQVTQTAASAVEADWLILPVRPNESPVAAGSVATQLEQQGDLDTSAGSVSTVPVTDAVAAKRVCFAGFGGASDDRRDLNSSVAAAFFKVLESHHETVAFALPTGVDAAIVAETVVRSAIVAGVGQAVYQAENKRSLPDQLVLVCDAETNPDSLYEAIDKGRVLGDSINTVRDFVNRHAGDIYPETFAEAASELAESADLECRVYDDDWLREEKFGSMLAVAQGSEKPARLVVLKYAGAPESDETIGICGKGVTFDSGGLSLKPSDSMTAMKSDMAGGATVLGTLLAVAKLKLPVNVIGAIGLVENMISGNCYRLGDVLTARNGTTIEIHNTDAEGRLVLADVLSWTVDQGATRLIDLATLTGACVVALGNDITGLFPNDDAWAGEIIEAADAVGEDVWQLPMHDAFNDQLKSDVADCKNVGTRWGGATTAAKFLEKFVGGTTWAHLDIAGPSFASSANSQRDGGATGAMVQTLVELMSRRG